MQSTRTARELADAVRAVLPYWAKDSARAIDELAARLEEKVSTTRLEGFNAFTPLRNEINSFKFDLAKLCSEHRVRADLTCIYKVSHPAQALFTLSNGAFTCQAPLPPAESCAHAVQRFREALLLLTKRHEVGVEIGHIEPGQCEGGIEDLNVNELDDRFIDAERERGAWDKIEAWIDRAPLGSARSVEFRKPKQRHDEFKYSIIFDQRESSVRMCDGVRSSQSESKPVRALSRIGALEAAAAWCEGQK